MLGLPVANSGFPGGSGGPDHIKEKKKRLSKYICCAIEFVRGE